MGIPKEPWSRIHIDYAGPYLNNYFLIVVDAYTKWLEVVPTASITAAATVNILKKIYTTFGLPITQVSDNGRQFRSQEMLQFLKENGIQAKFTAPFHPSSNGQAERCGKLHYEIEVDGKIHHRHVDQIIKTYCMSDNQYPPDTYQFNPMQPRETVQVTAERKESTPIQRVPEETIHIIPSPGPINKPASPAREQKELQQEQEPTLPTVVPTEPTNTNMYLPSPIAVRRPQRIRKVAKKAYAYSVMADESCDIAGREQLSFGIRFYDEGEQYAAIYDHIKPEKSNRSVQDTIRREIGLKVDATGKAAINYVARPRGGRDKLKRTRGMGGVESKATWFSSDENFVE
ncbi:Uncharacterized protein K02A2.6 [Eumeta japonica]|uniref:Uncharacterized protein K02A2.6 n=1 Tax=Eumeta variegata TaxID=151549 RepID=A0A4C1TZW3_EUMVA|nr:Uncharacterized protein K02A2.6 [Eumeta japonica]